MTQEVKRLSKVNAEEWIRKAVEGLDMLLFHGDLNILDHPYQVSWGRCKGNKVTECIQPSDNEDITLADFFPTTIVVDFKAKNDVELLGNLALECIHAFFNEKKSSTKKFKQLANKYYFEAPYKSFNPSNELTIILEEVYKNLIDTYGEFPSKPVSFPKKQKNATKNSYVLFCPECGMELKVTKKMLQKHRMAMPTCACGCKFSCDMEDENEHETGTE